MFKFQSINFILGISILFSNPILNNGTMPKTKPNKIESNTHLNTPIIDSDFQPNISRSLNSTYITSSMNGYGLVASQTRPIDNQDDNWVLVFREYDGDDAGSGQIGIAQSDDIINNNWNVSSNINVNGDVPWGGLNGNGVALGRYPSALAGMDYPYAIWNEYTAQSGLYGGRPYINFDEFGWGGDSWSYPLDVDLTWGQFGDSDHWVGSPEYTFDSNMDMGVINVMYTDWTRQNYYHFRTELIEDGFSIFAQEEMIVDMQDLWSPDGSDPSGYASSPALSMNDNGEGIMGFVGFLGSPQDFCSTESLHVPIFKLTDNHGQNFYGNDCNGYYHLPVNVIDDIVSKNEDGRIVQHCNNNSDDFGPDVDFDGDGLIEEFEDGWIAYPSSYFFWYNSDFRVDLNGNIHIISYLIAEDDEDIFHWFGGTSGYYHFTINKEDIDNPGPVNSPTGWNWTFLHDIFNGNGIGWDVDLSGGADEFENLMSQISVSKDDSGVVWAVFNDTVWEFTDEYAQEFQESCWGWQTHGGVGVYDNTTITWTYDIFVAKSEDSGQSWSQPVNVTQTTVQGGDPVFYDGIDEMDPHTAGFSDDDNVYFMYQMPDYRNNTIDDSSYIYADHMNDVYVAYVGEDIDFDFNSCSSDLNGDINQDGQLDIIDIVNTVIYLTGGPEFDECQIANGDVNNDGNVDILDIVTMVNTILGNNRTSDATSAIMYETASGVDISSDGYLGAVELTLSHDLGFELELTSDALVAEYKTNATTTKLIVVAPETDHIFSTDDAFEVDEVLAVNSNEFIDVVKHVSEFNLSAAYPNPFNPTTNIDFSVSEAGYASVKVYNLMGQVVGTLIDGMVDADTYSLTWDAQHLSSGVYMIKAESNGQVATQKIMLLK